MTSFRVSTVLALSFALAPALALGQTERSSIEIARAHMDQGQAYYLQGRFGEAAAEFEAAYEAEPFSAFLYNAAVAYENAGDPVRAADFFLRYVDREPRARDRAEVEERIDRLRALIETQRAEAERLAREHESGAAQPVETPPPTPVAPEALPQDFKSLVSVRTDPEGARVTILSDGNEVAQGFSPFSYTLDQGRYRLRIEHPDFNTAEEDLLIEPGKVYVIVVNLSQGEFLGYLRVVSDPPGAQVLLDDRSAGPRGQTPFEGTVAVGEHRVWIERPGYEPIEREVEVGIGSQIDLRVELERVTHGRVRVISNLRGARILVDGDEVGRVPWEGDVDAGQHTLRVEGDGMKAFEQEIEVARGQLTPVRVRLRPDVGREGAYVSAVLGVLAIGGGIALSVISDELRATLAAERDRGTLATNDERLDHGLYYAIGSYAGYGVGLILGIVSLYYFLYDPLPPSEGTVLEPRDWTLAPILDHERGTVGGAVVGRF